MLECYPLLANTFYRLILLMREYTFKGTFTILTIVNALVYI